MTPIRVFDNAVAGRIRRIVFTAALLGLAAGPFLGQSAEDLRITVGKSIVIDYPADIRQISTSNPEIVDANPVTTREILLNAKGLGSATMVVWSKADQRMFYNVTVELNLEPLRRILQDTFPDEKIDIHSSRDSISLNGTVSSKDVADRAVALSATFAKTVVNNLQLAPGPIEKQILLRVKFAELDRSKAQQFGVNLFSTGALNTIGTVSTGQFNSGTGASRQRRQSCQGHRDGRPQLLRVPSGLEHRCVRQGSGAGKRPADSCRAEFGDHQRKRSQFPGGR